LEVVSTDPAIDIEDLSAEIKISADPTLHRRQIDLAERHAARGDLRIIEATIARDGEHELGEVARDLAAVLPL
jgi:hypothetical protein